MTSLYEYAGLGLLLLWSFYRLASLYFGPINALRVGVIGASILSLAAPWFLFAMVAIFAPFGAVLPAIAAQNLLTHFTGRQGARLYLWELIIALIVYDVFLYA